MQIDNCLRCAQKFALAKANNADQAEKNKFKKQSLHILASTVIVLKMQISGSHIDRGSESFRNCVETEVANCVCVCAVETDTVSTHTDAATHPPIRQ